MDSNGLSDPYCIVGLADPVSHRFIDPSRNITSEVKWWTLQPIWKKATLEIDASKLKSTIRIEVWDKDTGKDDDFMGVAIIKLDSAQPDAWYPLKAEKPNEKVSGDIHVTVLKALASSKTAASVVSAEDQSDTAQDLFDLAVKLQGDGKFLEAIENYKKALAIRINLFGENHLDTVAILNNMGRTYAALAQQADKQTNLEEALACFKRGLDIFVYLYGENHADTARAIYNVQFIYQSLEKLEESLGCSLRSLEVHAKLFGENHPHTAMVLNNTGEAYVKVGKFDEAINCFERAIKSFYNSPLGDRFKVSLEGKIYDCEMKKQQVIMRS